MIILRVKNYNYYLNCIEIKVKNYLEPILVQKNNFHFLEKLYLFIFQNLFKEFY